MIENEPQFSYFGYGLEIDSVIPLTELPVSSGAADLKVRFGDLRERAPDREQTYTFAASPRELGRHWPLFGAFLARDGREIIVDPAGGVKTSSLSPSITGPMMACILHQRGYLVLHASALIFENKGIAFLAEAGEGKSTLTAYLASRGGTLIADDVVPLVFSGSEVLTVPGYPQIRLWSDSLSSIGVDHRRLPTVNEYIDKRFYSVAREFPENPVALRALFIVGEADEVSIERFGPADAFVEIARHTYLKRHVAETGRAAEHFECYRRLVASIPIFRLLRPKNFQILPAVADMIERRLSEI